MKKKENTANLMVDRKSIERICGYADIGRSDSVLEIGAGTGNLTEALAAHAGHVYAVEKNAGFCGILEGKFSGAGNVEIICGDALRVGFPSFDKVVSNLPYHISRKFSERLLQEKFNLAVIVYQKEFAEKLVALPGSDSYRNISALAQSCAKIEVLDTIPPEAFSPKPKVYSSIVRMRQKMLPEKEYVEFLRTLFSQKNKLVEKILGRNVPPAFAKKRPRQITPAELRRLYLIILPVIK